jgi:hypothetical protein
MNATQTPALTSTEARWLAPAAHLTASQRAALVALLGVTDTEATEVGSSRTTADALVRAGLARSRFVPSVIGAGGLNDGATLYTLTTAGRRAARIIRRG